MSPLRRLLGQVGLGFSVLVIVSPALPLPKGHFHPRPCCSIGAPSGSGGT